MFFKSVLNLNGMETSRRGKSGDGTIHTLEAVGTDGKGGNGTDFTGVIIFTRMTEVDISKEKELLFLSCHHPSRGGPWLP